MFVAVNAEGEVSLFEISLNTIINLLAFLTAGVSALNMGPKKVLERPLP